MRKTNKNDKDKDKDKDKRHKKQKTKTKTKAKQIRPWWVCWYTMPGQETERLGAKALIMHVVSSLSLSPV